MAWPGRGAAARGRDGKGWSHTHTHIGVLTSTHMIFIFCAISQRCLPKLIYALVTAQISRGKGRENAAAIASVVVVVVSFEKLGEETKLELGGI